MTTLPTGPLPSSPVSLTVPAGDGTDLTLHGTLLTPGTPGPWPLALLHAGSGLADRDGNSVLAPTPNDSLLQLAQALAVNGIASVRYDKCGVGESRPDLTPDLITADHQARDAAAWLRQLSLDARFTIVVPVEHSAGGQQHQQPAQEGQTAQGEGVSVPGVVTLAGPGRPLREILEGPLIPIAVESL